MDPANAWHSPALAMRSPFSIKVRFPISWARPLTNIRMTRLFYDDKPEYRVIMAKAFRGYALLEQDLGEFLDRKTSVLGLSTSGDDWTARAGH